MADLNPAALDRFIGATVQKVIEVTGLAADEARVAAVDLVPPFEEDGRGNAVLRGEAGQVIGLVPLAELDPYEVLEGLE